MSAFWATCPCGARIDEPRNDQTTRVRFSKFRRAHAFCPAAPIPPIPDIPLARYDICTCTLPRFMHPGVAGCAEFVPAFEPLTLADMWTA